MSLIERLRAKRIQGDLDQETGFGRVMVADPDCLEAATQLEAMQAEIDRLNAEIARLRNIMNEDGLHDPELAKLAGKRRNALEASNEEGGRRFRASLDRQGK